MPRGTLLSLSSLNQNSEDKGKMKTKSFDCVEMKRRIQEQIRTEYESRKNEFSSYVDFLNAKANQSPWVQIMREKIRDRK